MKKHVKIYLDYFGYDVNSFIDCEVCGGRAVDIHHIEPRGMGGVKQRRNHKPTSTMQTLPHYYGDKKQYKEFLKEKHLIKLATNKVSTK
jgi:hypothetical protein